MQQKILLLVVSMANFHFYVVLYLRVPMMWAFQKVVDWDL